MLTRKELLGRVGAGAAVLFVGPLCAEKEPDHSGNPLAVAAAESARVGQECLTHCIQLLSKGDQSLADCATTVRDMITACTALEGFAAANSKHLRAYLPVCRSVCEECHKACLKHAEHHAICKQCADACKACLDAMAAA